MAAVRKLINVLFSKPFSNPVRYLSLPSASCLSESFKFSDLKIEYATDARKKPKSNLTDPVFGITFSDHMFQVNWIQSSGWGIPEIAPIHPFACHPGSKVFHYAQSIFEGLKAFKCSDGSVNLFRPKLHIKRLLESAERAALPLFDGEEFFECLKKLISIENDWVPDCTSSSLYIRPILIGLQHSLKIEASDTALLYVIASPVGPYCKIHPMEPVSFLTEATYVRAWPGGVGDKKMGCNYAPTFYVQDRAKKEGLDEVLWLTGEDQKVSEGSAMNVFFVFQKGSNEFELATPVLDGTILPGITRLSFLEMARQWSEFEVSERIITMDEVVKAVEEKTLTEMFVCGTAVTLCPVYKIRYLNKDIDIPTMRSTNPIFLRLYRSLTDIQYGRVESDWVVNIK